MNAADHAYLPSSSGEIIAPAVVFAGPTGVWRGVRDGMGWGAPYVSRSGGGSAGGPRARSVAVIAHAWFPTPEDYSRFGRDDWSLVENLPLRNRHLRFFDLSPLRCVHRGDLGYDGRRTSRGQCELLERSRALHVGSRGS